MLFITLAALIVIIAVSAFLFIKFYPTFGGKQTEARRLQFEALPHYENGVFVNQVPTSVMEINVKNFVGFFKEQFTNKELREPKAKLQAEKLDSLDIVNNLETRLTWFGHSALLLEMEGAKIFIDPMLGESPAPHPLLGKARFAGLPIEIEQLPELDAVVISHDHYDHLDYTSIQKLKAKVKKFYVPLGVDAHLLAWGVSPDAIESLDWWDETSINGIKLVFAPSRHFSGRGLGDRDATLWGSWAFIGEKEKIYFSGDGGYGPHFKEIGEKYGPFDFAMMECGQYDKRWSDIHMMPEESVQGGVDVGAKVVMPIHWGAFVLAFHDWRDPVQRAIAKADELNIPIITPKIGEPFAIKDLNKEFPHWWERPNVVN